MTKDLFPDIPGDGDVFEGLRVSGDWLMYISEFMGMIDFGHELI